MWFISAHKLVPFPTGVNECTLTPTHAPDQKSAPWVTSDEKYINKQMNNVSKQVSEATLVRSTVCLSSPRKDSMFQLKSKVNIRL